MNDEPRAVDGAAAGAVSSRAYNRWLIDKLLSADDRIKSLVYVPFNTPVEAERVVKDFANEKGVIGFCVPSTRNKPVHHNDYMRLYAMIQETGKPCKLSQPRRNFNCGAKPVWAH